jgi:hypothetical protein
MSSISAHAASLPSGNSLQKLLEPFDIVLDCTGDDDVLKRLGDTWWTIPRRFLSVSFGFAAKRLIMFGAQACAFPFEEFSVAVKPWLNVERLEWSTAGESLEGAGCWSPLFPARCDDVWLGAVATVKYLERIVQGAWLNEIRVLEQAWIVQRPCQNERSLKTGQQGRRAAAESVPRCGPRTARAARIGVRH